MKQYNIILTPKLNRFKFWCINKNINRIRLNSLYKCDYVLRANCSSENKQEEILDYNVRRVGNRITTFFNVPNVLLHGLNEVTPTDMVGFFSF